MAKHCYKMYIPYMSSYHTRPQTHLLHASHDGKLLCVNETLQHHSYGHVDVIIMYILTKVKLSMCFRQSDDGFNMSDSYWDAASSL